MKKTFAFILIMCLSVSAFAQESFSSVEERMTGREFKDTGLDKLTDAELEALNKWLRDHSVATLETRTVRNSAAAVVAPSNTGAEQSGRASQTASSTDTAIDRRGFEGKVSNTDTIVSRLVGNFTGWDGETVFTLENGMVWKQAQSSSYFTKEIVNPQVEIRPGMWNSWKLTVDGNNRSLQVERIQ